MADILKMLACALQAAKADFPQEEDQEDEDLCVVCWEELRAVIFYNCMHMVCSCNPESHF